MKIPLNNLLASLGFGDLALDEKQTKELKKSLQELYLKQVAQETLDEVQAAKPKTT